MTKRILAIIVLVCMGILMISACESKEKITAGEAVAIVQNDLGIDNAAMGEPHIHTGTYKNTACFNIYVNIRTLIIDGKLLWIEFFFSILYGS